MKILLCILTAVLMLASLCACGAPIAPSGAPEAPAEPAPVTSDSLYVKRVEALPEDFILGMDASCVIAEENSGVVYRNFAGEEQDVYKTLAENGINYIRARVWNDPYDEQGNGFGGGNCDIDNCVLIGRRATEYGMKLLVDFHYSDFWADPSKQMCPREWEGMDIEEKTEACYEYTRDCLIKLRDAGVDVGMVQVGNETNGAMAGEKKWFNIQYLMQAGARATREVYPEALVAVHFANPEKEGAYENYASKLDYYQVDYDVFASSYYPYWHGTLENLARVLSNIANRYGKKTMVAETAYAYTADDTDFNGNTVSNGGGITKSYPFTVQGQANAVRDVIDTVANDTLNGIGVFYWEGTWISVGTESYKENFELWEKYGSGWASSYAAVYDPDDAGKYYGGCAVDNQAMFDSHGDPLESLKVFALARSGNELEPVPDSMEDPVLSFDLNGEIVMPDTVNAVMTDDSKRPVPVTWDITPEMLDTMYSSGAAVYDIPGEAEGMPVNCRVTMLEFNFLSNYSFEDGELGAWRVRDLKNCDELYVEDKVTDSLTGNHHMHFWSSAPNSVEFTLEQDVQDLKPGSYKFSVSIMGGDCGEAVIRAYVRINGEEVASAPMTITSYGNWDTALITDIEYAEGDILTVGVYVKAPGEGNGAWGKIDDAMLNSMS